MIHFQGIRFSDFFYSVITVLKNYSKVSPIIDFAKKEDVFGASKTLKLRFKGKSDIFSLTVYGVAFFTFFSSKVWHIIFGPFILTLF